MNIPMLVDGAGSVSIGAAVAGAVARSLLSICSFSLANSSSEKFTAISFRESLLGSSIFVLQRQKFLVDEVPSLKVLQDPTLSVFRSPRALTFGYGCAVHVGVNVEAGDAEKDVIYITFVMSAQYTGYLVLYKVRYNWTTDVTCTDTGFRQGSTKFIPL